MIIAFNKIGTILASSSGNKTIILWNMENYNIIHIFEVSDVYCIIIFNPDGKILVGENDSGTIKLWDIIDQSEIITIAILYN